MIKIILVDQRSICILFDLQIVNFQWNKWIPISLKNFHKILWVGLVARLLIKFILIIPTFRIKSFNKEYIHRYLHILDNHSLFKFPQICYEIFKNFSSFISKFQLKLFNIFGCFDFPAIRKTFCKKCFGLHIHVYDLAPCDISIFEPLIINRIVIVITY